MARRGEVRYGRRGTSLALRLMNYRSAVTRKPNAFGFGRHFYERGFQEPEELHRVRVRFSVVARFDGDRHHDSVAHPTVPTGSSDAEAAE